MKKILVGLGLFVVVALMMLSLRARAQGPNWPNGFPHPTDAAIELYALQDMAYYQGTASDGSQAVATYNAATQTQKDTWFTAIYNDIAAHGIGSTEDGADCRYYFAHDALFLLAVPGLSLLKKKRATGLAALAVRK